MTNYLSNLQFQLVREYDDYSPLPTTKEEYLSVPFIQRIRDAHGNDDNASISNNPQHKDWDSNDDMLDLPGYVQWIEADNVPLPPVGEENLLINYKKNAKSQIDIEAFSVQQLLGTTTEVFTYSIKQQEINFYDSDDKTDVTKYESFYAYDEAKDANNDNFPTIEQIGTIIEKYRFAATVVEPFEKRRTTIRTRAKEFVDSASTVDEVANVLNIVKNKFETLKKQINKTLR